MDRTRATASAEEPAPVPTQTILVTPASEARAMVAGQSRGVGPRGVDAVPLVGLGELVLEVAVGVEPLDDGVVHLDPGQSLRRGKRGAPFSTGRPPG